MRALSLAVLALPWTALAPAAAHQTGAPQPPAPTAAANVDWAKLADLTINRSLKLAPGERVLFYWDQTADRIAAPAWRSAVVAAGGIVASEIHVPSRADVEAMRTLSDGAQAHQRQLYWEAWGQAFAGADVAIWFGGPKAPFLERPFEKLVERHKVRSIHFHWFMPPDAADVPEIEAMYMRAIAVDPKALDVRIGAVESALRGQRVTIKAGNGTSLSLRIPSDAWVHRNTGDASRAKVASARSVRDREEELPASVFRTTDLADLEGTFVAYAAYDMRSPILQATFSAGRLARLESKRGAEDIVATWEKATGDKHAAGELVISTNPELAALQASGNMPYYGYGSGIVRLAIGDNWESGGRNRTSNGEILLFLPGATLEAGGKAVIRDGALLVGSAKP